MFFQHSNEYKIKTHNVFETKLKFSLSSHSSDDSQCSLVHSRLRHRISYSVVRYIDDTSLNITGKKSFSSIFKKTPK